MSKSNRVEKSNNQKNGGKVEGVKSVLDLIRQKNDAGVYSPSKVRAASSVFNARSGVVLTKVFNGDVLVGCTIEGAYKARGFCTGSITPQQLKLLAPYEVDIVKSIPIMGKFWKKDKALLCIDASGIGTLEELAPYLISQTTKAAGTGSVLLFSITQCVEKSPPLDFKTDVYDVIRSYFSVTKDPPSDADLATIDKWSSTEAENKWDLWPDWTVSEEEYTLIGDAQMSAFVELSLTV